MPCGKYGGKDDSEDGAPRELPYMVEKELVEKQNKHNYLLEKYIPNVLNGWCYFFELEGWAS